MILRVGDVIQYAATPETVIRVLWISDCTESVITIDVHEPTALPVPRKSKDLGTALQDGHARLMEEPYQIYISEDALKARDKAIRDRGWRLIETIVNRTPYIFQPSNRGALIREVMTSEIEQGRKASFSSIFRYLRRFWQRGLTRNALLPDYAQCGGKGKERVAGKKKRGRPRKFGEDKGVNITADIRQLMRVCVARWYASAERKAWNLKDAYEKLIEDYFSEREYDPETGVVISKLGKRANEAGSVPTMRQFEYYVAKDHLRLDVKRKRLGPRVYDKDFRGLVGTSNAQVKGPGDRYQIDATIVDVYLVSRVNKKWIIGRPVLYVVIDVFSRVIVGLYIGIEGPSWVGAMMALANTAEDKVEFCKHFGIDIETEDWPCHFLPGAVLADRGELESALVDALINNFNVVVENSAPYRADWKGIVEQQFRLLPAKFKKYVPGYIQTDFMARGGTDYRLDAVLDLDEFTRIIIRCVLMYNKFHEIETYDRDREVAADEVPSIPLDLWEWGMRHRSGSMREYPLDLVQFSLMPTGKASVTELGIYFQGIYYTCPKAIEERWFDKARQGSRWKVDISYDPRDMDRIYLHEEGAPLAFQICTTTDRSREIEHLSMWEIGQMHDRAKHQRADRRTDSLLRKVDLNVANEQEVESAKAKQQPALDESAASRTRAIRENRAREKAANRENEAFRLGHGQADTHRAPAEVVKFPSQTRGADDDYSPPSIDEILGEESGDVS